MLNTTPNGLFGLVPPTTAAPQSIAPPAAFVYGAGGKRYSPDELAALRKRAQGLQTAGMDYSPVESWTQGLARVADALVGRSLEKDADKASQANSAESSAVLQAFMGGGTPANGTLIAAQANPYISDDVKGVAKTIWSKNNPAAQQPTDFQRKLADAGILPGTPEYVAANKAAVDAVADPFVTTSLPGGRFYSGRQSGLAGALGMGSPESAPPATLPKDYFDKGGPTQRASGGFR